MTFQPGDLVALDKNTTSDPCLVVFDSNFKLLVRLEPAQCVLVLGKNLLPDNVRRYLSSDRPGGTTTVLTTKGIGYIISCYAKKVA